MSWPVARAALRVVLETLGHPVYLVPPYTVEDDLPIIVMTPPARVIERRASSVRRTTYTQRIRVMGRLGEAGSDADDAALAVDSVVEDIIALFDQHLQLGGAAVNITPSDWEEMAVIDWPTGSGIFFASQTGSIDIEVEEATETFGV